MLCRQHIFLSSEMEKWRKYRKSLMREMRERRGKREKREKRGNDENDGRDQFVISTFALQKNHFFLSIYFRVVYFIFHWSLDACACAELDLSELFPLFLDLFRL